MPQSDRKAEAPGTGLWWWWRRWREEEDEGEEDEEEVLPASASLSASLSALRRRSLRACSRPELRVGSRRCGGGGEVRLGGCMGGGTGGGMGGGMGRFLSNPVLSYIDLRWVGGREEARGDVSLGCFFLQLLQ